MKIPKSETSAQRMKHVILLKASKYILSNIGSHCFSYQKEGNRTYNCENLGLREIPDTLPNTTEVLEFSFNFLPTIQKYNLQQAHINLIFLDLTRFVSEFLCVLDVLLR